MGYYMACDYRAAFDRAVHEGKFVLDDDAEDRPKPYADFGTMAHWIMQSMMGCVFPSGDAKNHMFDQAQWDCAAKLFDNDLDTTLIKAREVALLGIDQMPKTPDGLPWLAETHLENPHNSGHIDFLSQDHATIVDLKTTSKKPPYGRIKPEHLVQQVVYGLLTGKTERCYVLYVSSRGDWVMLSKPFMFTTPEGQWFTNHVREFSAYLNGDELYQRAFPRLSLSGCYESFCPYTHVCRDVVIPAAATVQGVAARSNVPPPASSNLF